MQHEIIWPEKYLLGTTDNYCSNEVIVAGITTEDVWEYLVNPFAWPTYYANSSVGGNPNRPPCKHQLTDKTNNPSPSTARQ